MDKTERRLLFFRQLYGFIEREIGRVAAVDRHQDVFIHITVPNLSSRTCKNNNKSII